MQIINKIVISCGIEYFVFFFVHFGRNTVLLLMLAGGEKWFMFTLTMYFQIIFLIRAICFERLDLKRKLTLSILNPFATSRRLHKLLEFESRQSNGEKKGLEELTFNQTLQVNRPKNSSIWTLQIKYPQIRDGGVYECQINTEVSFFSACSESIALMAFYNFQPKMSLSYTLNIIGEYI